MLLRVVQQIGRTLAEQLVPGVVVESQSGVVARSTPHQGEHHYQQHGPGHVQQEGLRNAAVFVVVELSVAAVQSVTGCLVFLNPKSISITDIFWSFSAPKIRRCTPKSAFLF